MISSSILSTPTTFDTRRQVAIAAIGIITEFVMKSKKSRNCIPRILKFARGPYPRQESVPSSNITIPMNTVDFYGSSVVHLRTSKQHFLSVRSNLSQLQTVLIRKYNTDRSSKSHVCKTFGIVINIKAGPDFNVSALPPEKAKTAGMIISPAMIAIAVSKISTFSVDFQWKYLSSYKNQM